MPKAAKTRKVLEL